MSVVPLLRFTGRCKDESGGGGGKPAPLPVSLDLGKAIRLDVAASFGPARSVLETAGLVAVLGGSFEAALVVVAPIPVVVIVL